GYSRLRRPRPKADGEARGDKEPPQAAVTLVSDALGRRPTARPAETKSRRRRRLLSSPTPSAEGRRRGPRRQGAAAGGGYSRLRRPRPKADGEAGGDKEPPQAAVTARRHANSPVVRSAEFPAGKGACGQWGLIL